MGFVSGRSGQSTLEMLARSLAALVETSDTPMLLGSALTGIGQAKSLKSFKADGAFNLKKVNGKLPSPLMLVSIVDGKAKPWYLYSSATISQQRAEEWAAEQQKQIAAKKAAVVQAGQQAGLQQLQQRLHAGPGYGTVAGYMDSGSGKHWAAAAARQGSGSGSGGPASSAADDDGSGSSGGPASSAADDDGSGSSGGPAGSAAGDDGSGSSGGPTGSAAGDDGSGSSGGPTGSAADRVKLFQHLFKHKTGTIFVPDPKVAAGTTRASSNSSLVLFNAPVVGGFGRMTASCLYIALNEQVALSAMAKLQQDLVSWRGGGEKRAAANIAGAKAHKQARKKAKHGRWLAQCSGEEMAMD